MSHGSSAKVIARKSDSLHQDQCNKKLIVEKFMAKKFKSLRIVEVSDDTYLGLFFLEKSRNLLKLKFDFSQFDFIVKVRIISKKRQSYS